MSRVGVTEVTMLLAALFTVVSFVGSQVFSNNLLALPLLTISIASAGYLLYVYAEKNPIETNEDSKYPGLIDIALFILLFISIVVGRIGGEGILDWYYIIVIATSTILAFRLMTRPLNVPLHLIQIVFLGIIVRATPWFSYPVYGQDSRLHKAATGYILSTGDTIPESVSYYANYQMAHRFVASYTYLTDMPLKSGFFSLGVVASISLLGVFILARYVLTDDRAALFSTLIVAVSTYHIDAGASPTAQALFTALFPLIAFLLLLKTPSKSHVAMFTFLAFTAIMTQNIAPLVLVGLCIALIISAWVTVIMYKASRSTRPIHPFLPDFSLLFLLSIAGIYFYMVADYFRFQVMRFVWMVESLVGPSSSQTSPGDAGGIPTVSIFDYELPGLLMWGAPILIIAGILVLSGYILVNELSKDGVQPDSAQYILMAGTIFSIFALVFVAGGPATRALPSVIVLSSPIAGWMTYKFDLSHPPLARSVAVVLVLCTVTAGVLAPAVAKSELGEDDFKPYMGSEEQAVVDFADKRTTETQADKYSASYARLERISRGETGTGVSVNSVLDRNEPASTQRFLDNTGNRSTLYLSSYEGVYGITKPNSSRVYSSGGGSLYSSG